MDLSRERDDDQRTPTYNDLVVPESIERMKYPDPLRYDRSPKKKNKKKMKQMPIKRAVKNMKPKNFQGYDVEKCTLVDGGQQVFIPPKYGRLSRKKYRNRQVPVSHGVCCPDCKLVPCSMIEYGDELEGEVGNVDNWLIGQEAILDKIRTKYRKLVMHDCGKKYMLQCMPSNQQLPSCALARTQHLVQRELGGYDSLLDTSEYEEIESAVTGGQQPALLYESSSDEEELTV